MLREALHLATANDGTRVWALARSVTPRLR
jgi:hypothetical protein